MIRTMIVLAVQMHAAREAERYARHACPHPPLADDPLPCGDYPSRRSPGKVLHVRCGPCVADG
jgi:hypothetical protein